MPHFCRFVETYKVAWAAVTRQVFFLHSWIANSSDVYLSNSKIVCSKNTIFSIRCAAALKKLLVENIQIDVFIWWMNPKLSLKKNPIIYFYSAIFAKKIEGIFLESTKCLNIFLEVETGKVHIFLPFTNIFGIWRISVIILQGGSSKKFLG